MSDIRFAWRQDKYERVQDKHDASFGEAVDALLDEHGVDRPDKTHWERSVFTGQTLRGRLLSVVYAVEVDDDAELTYRLITAYNASQEERDVYEGR